MSGPAVAEPTRVSVHEGVVVDTRALKRSAVDAAVGAGVFTIVVPAALLSITAVVGGSIAFVVGLIVTVVRFQSIFAVLMAAIILPIVWTASLWVAVEALERVGLSFRGRTVYLLMPFAPAIAIVLGPLAFLVGLGRNTGGRAFFALVGLVLLVGLVRGGALLFLGI